MAFLCGFIVIIDRGAHIRSGHQSHITIRVVRLRPAKPCSATGSGHSTNPDIIPT
ncbi:MAG TPA: hypothetical protein PKM50_08935 [Methanoregula sp.]|nr:hypothetical protein [Methanoregula sp.]